MPLEGIASLTRILDPILSLSLSTACSPLVIYEYPSRTRSTNEFPYVSLIVLPMPIPPEGARNTRLT